MVFLLKKLLHLGVSIEAVFKRVWERIEPFIFSKSEAARRATGRFELLKRQEMEAERLDRLRHPGDYQGR